MVAARFDRGLECTRGVSIFILALCCLQMACGGTSPPSSPTDFCRRETAATCDKAFKCVPVDQQTDPSFVTLFGSSVSECKGAKTDPICADAEAACQTWNPSLAQTCLEKLATSVAQPCGAPSTSAQ